MNRHGDSEPGGAAPVRGVFEHIDELMQFYRRLSALLRSGPVGIVGVDAAGLVRYWSRSCRSILGYGPKEVEGNCCLADFCSDPSVSDMERALSDGHVMEEAVFIHKDGSPRILHQIILPVFTGRGRHDGFTVCLLDVTERREAEEALRREKNMLNLVLDTMGAGLALFDREKRLQWANNTLLQWYGASVGELKGRKCSEIYRCERLRCEKCALGKVVETGETQSFESGRTGSDGNWRFFHHRATPLELGRKQYLVLTLDVTEERRRKEHLSVINELTRALTRSLDPQRVQHLVLTCVTAGHALGFNRAFLFLLNDESGLIEGSMAVGPVSGEGAKRIWREVSQSVGSLEELLDRSELAESDMELSKKISSFRVALEDGSSVVADSIRELRTNLVRDAEEDKRADDDLARLLGLREFVVSPLVARGRAIGAILADNKFSCDPIRTDQVLLLEEFTGHASLAINNAFDYRKLRDQMEELEKTQGRLVEAERLASVGRMAAHMAHEIRNPLTTVGGFAKSIERNFENPELVKRSAAIIYGEALRLEGVLNDALDFSRPVRLEKTRLNMNELLKGVLQEYAGVFEEKSIRFQLNLDKELPQIYADEARIKQVVINLVQNALDALEYAPEKSLFIGTYQMDEKVVVSVSDSGQGMDDDTLEAVFAPFFTTRKGGSGLGLAICRKIVVEHGGSITVDSTLGKGASFYVMLPKRV